MALHWVQLAATLAAAFEVQLPEQQLAEDAVIALQNLLLVAISVHRVVQAEASGECDVKGQGGGIHSLEAIQLNASVRSPTVHPLARE